MKKLQTILTAGLALTLLNLSAPAETFQVIADTTSVKKTSTIAKTAGALPNLTVSPKSSAYLKFNVFASGIDPATVKQARLVIYLPKVLKPGTLTLTVNGTDFAETFPTKTIATPTTVADVSFVGVTAANTKNFITFDVTNEVKVWLTGGAEFGFGLESDGTASVLVGAKEGPGSGYPAVLEVDVTDLGGAINGTTGTFSDAVTGSSGTFAGPLAATTASFSGNVAGTNLNFTGNVNAAIGAFSTAVIAKNGGFTGQVLVTGTTATDKPLFLGQGITNSFAEVESLATGMTGYSQKNVNQSYFTGLLSGSDRWSLFDATALKERLTVLPSGPVGINNPTPAFALDIASDGDTEFALRSRSVNGRVYTFQSSNGGVGDGSFQIVDRNIGAARLMISKTGNVGIGTSVLSFPTAKLDVRGDVKLGATGQFFAVGADENLRTVRGHVTLANVPGGIFAGQGFTVARGVLPTGHFKVTLNTAFSGVCTPTVSPLNFLYARVLNVTNNSFEVQFADNNFIFSDSDFTFIVTGPK